MREFHIDTQVWLPRTIDETFAFFSDAHNLEEITPPFLRFHVLTPRPIAMRVGQRIDYRLRLRGIPVRWQSEITAWEPPGTVRKGFARFVDEQRRGPYRRWIHEHVFEEADGGTCVRDRIRYAVIGGALVNQLFVGRDLKRIFRFRGERLQHLLGAAPHPKSFAG